jgi:hypothetical protein
MRKRKALKGGNFKFTNPTLAGPQLKESLYRTNDDEIININNTYQNYLNEAEKDLNRTLAIKKEADEQLIKEVKLEQKEDDIQQKANAKKNALYQKYMVMFGNSVAFMLASMARIAQFISNLVMTNGRFAFKMFATAGQGAIIKVVIAIVIIVLIILGATNVIHGFKKPEMTNYNDGGKSILAFDSDKYLTMPKQDNIFTMMSQSLNNMIPSQYKYKWASISNSITYMTTGANIYDSFLEPRDEIDTGRSDNIFNINFNDDQNYTTSIIKPKPVKLEFNNNMYYDSDYNKIDETIMNDISSNYPNRCMIPIKENDNNKYVLKIDETVYYNNDTQINNTNKLIKNIFMKKKEDIKFNNFDNIQYTSFNNVNNIIAAYNTKLINPNYKGPILRLSSADKVSKQYNKEHKTANFYNKYKTDYLYCIIQNKEITFNEYFKNYINKRETIYVMGLYDQSGNEYHFTFEDHDNKYMPEYHQSYLKYNNVIKFHSRSILFLTKPISYKNIKLMIKMSIQDDIKTNIDFINLEKELKTTISNKEAKIIAAKEKKQERDDINDIKKQADYDALIANTNVKKADNDVTEATKARVKAIHKWEDLLNIDKVKIKNNYDRLYNEVYNVRDDKKPSTAQYNSFLAAKTQLQNIDNEILEAYNAKQEAIKKDDDAATALTDANTAKEAADKAKILADIEFKKTEPGGSIYKELYDANEAVTAAAATVDTAQNNYNKFQQQYKSNYVDTYMDFLAKRGSSTVKITISDTPSSKEFNIEYNEYKTKLSIDNNFIFDIENKTDNITFECIGNILDSRTDQEKRDVINGKNLGEMINKHSFRGLLSELRIFKNV